VIVGVALEGAALREGLLIDPVVVRSVHEEVLDALLSHGRLVFASADDLSAFGAAVRALPPRLSARWEAALASRRLGLDVAVPDTTPTVEACASLADVDAGWGRWADLVLMERSHAQAVGLDLEDVSVHTPGRPGMPAPPVPTRAAAAGAPVEVGRLPAALATDTMRAARDLADAPIRPGTSRDEVFATRFDPLVAESRTIVVFDRYAGMKAARRYVREREEPEGLAWFLSRVGAHPGRRVRLITSVQEPTRNPRSRRPPPLTEVEVAAGLRAVIASLPPGCDVRLEPVLVQDTAGERFGHDRHVRIGQRAAVSLGPGLDTFATEVIAEFATVGAIPLRDARDRETRAERAQLRPPPGGWLAEPPPEPTA
jgi:hypothetical protein